MGNKVILKRLNMSIRNRPPLALSKLSKFMKTKEGKIAVVVGTITDDKLALSSRVRLRSTSAGHQVFPTAMPSLTCGRRAGSLRRLVAAGLRAATGTRGVHSTITTGATSIAK